MTSKARIGDVPDDPRHGTTNGYTNLKCRCQRCRDAWSATSRYRRAKRALTPDDPRHGRYTTYSNHSCRCPACLAAHLVARQAYRQRRTRKAAP